MLNVLLYCPVAGHDEIQKKQIERMGFNVKLCGTFNTRSADLEKASSDNVDLMVIHVTAYDGIANLDWIREGFDGKYAKTNIIIYSPDKNLCPLDKKLCCAKCDEHTVYINSIATKFVAGIKTAARKLGFVIREQEEKTIPATRAITPMP